MELNKLIIINSFFTTIVYVQLNVQIFKGKSIKHNNCTANPCLVRLRIGLAVTFAFEAALVEVDRQLAFANFNNQK